MVTRTRVSVAPALAPAVFVLLLLGAPPTVWAAAYRISWWSVDCGSTLNLAGGNYQLCGTIGQPDAQRPPVMSGGRFELSGGFWPTIAVSFCEPCDVNCDGTVSIFDIDPLVALLSPGPPPRCSPCAGDTNSDGTVNMFDIVPFVNCLSAP